MELATGKKVEISNYLSTKYGLAKGNEIELQTPKGRQKFTITDTFSSYSTTSGFIYMDRKWLKEYWGLDDATQLGVYLKSGENVSRLSKK
jgi:putative ABC transport system permease protein